jgi:two-component system, OmpR family, KDP operon response regulator KdpE
MRVLVVDDDGDILQAVSLSLSFRWSECEVIPARDGEEGLRLFRDHQPDVVVLDIGLPGLSGIEVLRQIRTESSRPVLMLTARNQEADIVRALEIGADDYVSKPAGYLELTARIQSLVRRAQVPAIPVPALQTYSQGGLTIHFPSRDVEVEGRSIPLTNTEYRLLYHLVRNAGRIVSHRDLLQSAWGSDNYGEDVVRVYVSRLRAKIEPDPARPRFILTKSGLGYLFAGEAASTVEQAENGQELLGGNGLANDRAAQGQPRNQERPAKPTAIPQRSDSKRAPESEWSSSRMAAHAG